MVTSSVEFVTKSCFQAEILVMITAGTFSPEMTWGKGTWGYWR